MCRGFKKESGSYSREAALVKLAAFEKKQIRMQLLRSGSPPGSTSTPPPSPTTGRRWLTRCSPLDRISGPSRSRRTDRSWPHDAVPEGARRRRRLAAADQRSRAPNFLPAWSSSGERLLFQSQRSGNRDLFVMTSNRGRARQLTTDPTALFDSDPDWPKYERLYFNSGSGVPMDSRADAPGAQVIPSPIEPRD